MPMNESECVLYPNERPCFLHSEFPFYYSTEGQLIPGVPDVYLALAAPVISYWALSLLFHLFDVCDFRWMDRYRIHDSEEVLRRNRVSRTQVVSLVIVQQAIQTVLGLLWLSEVKANPLADMENLQRYLRPIIEIILGRQKVFATLSPLTFLMYWWVLPGLQLVCAFFIIDTWQYFLHRLMHTNKFLYKHLHSVHHRLYVPYAFGALYNHPIEGLILDSFGATLAEALVGLSTRQATLLFTLATLKTVDDHCGYKLPFDPLQMVTRNNSDYHDIHHQTIGIKSNFSQPFFVHWDVILGTRMTRLELEQRKQKQSKTM